MDIVRSARYRLVMGLLAVSAGLWITAPAPAQTATLDGVRIVGDPVVGQAVTAVISGSVDPTAVAFKWCRASDQPGRCAKGGPLGFDASYTPVAADVGSRLMVTASATIDTFTIKVKSSPSAPVAAAPPAPAPTPTAAPTPTPTPTPTASPTPEATTADPTPGAPAPAPTFTSSGVLPVTVAADPGAVPAVEAPRYLRPFPVVRIRGYVAARGARVTLLKVTAPSGVTVVVRCEGGGCPFARRRSGSAGRIRGLERFLLAGTRITVRVSRADLIGKYVQIRIRAGAPPSRRDACLIPGSARAVACPPA